MKNEDYRKKKEEASKYGLLETCQCCYIDELIPEECFFCQKGCVFCSECIQRGAETVIGKGDLRFPCYSNCDAEFSLQTLQVSFPSKFLSKCIFVYLVLLTKISNNVANLEIYSYSLVR